MTQPADRIQPNSTSRPNPGHTATDTADEDRPSAFKPIGPALKILHLNVEGLSEAKRSLIKVLAVKHNVDIICLEETHVDIDAANRFSIDGFDLLSYALHPKHGRALYVKKIVLLMRLHSKALPSAISYKLAVIKWPTCISHLANREIPSYSQPSPILRFMWGILTVITLTGAMVHQMMMGKNCSTGHRVMI